jgi:hypothetical protein
MTLMSAVVNIRVQTGLACSRRPASGGIDDVSSMF